jgi:hypothetical protein
MNRAGRWTLSLLLAGAAGLSLLIGAALVWGVPYDQVSLVIDGERIEVPPLTAGHWLVASVVVLIVLLVLMLLVPLVVAFALAAPVTLFAGALALGALGTVLAVSPLLLLGWLGWWLWKRSRTPPPGPSAGLPSDETARTAPPPPG